MNGIERKGKPPVELLQSPQMKTTPNRTDLLPKLLMAYKTHPDINIHNQLRLSVTNQKVVKS